MRPKHILFYFYHLCLLVCLYALYLYKCTPMPMQPYLVLTPAQYDTHRAAGTFMVQVTSGDLELIMESQRYPMISVVVPTIRNCSVDVILHTWSDWGTLKWYIGLPLVFSDDEELNIDCKLEKKGKIGLLIAGSFLKFIFHNILTSQQPIWNDTYLKGFSSARFRVILKLSPSE
jgi:hypothetical protein